MDRSAMPIQFLGDMQHLLLANLRHSEIYNQDDEDLMNVIHKVSITVLLQFLPQISNVVDLK